MIRDMPMTLPAITSVLTCSLALGLSVPLAWASDAPAKPSPPAATTTATEASPAPAGSSKPASKSSSKTPVEISAPVSSAKEMGNKVREALGVSTTPTKKLTLIINGEPVATGDLENSAITTPKPKPRPRPVAATPSSSHHTSSAAAPIGTEPGKVTQSSRKHLEARAAAGHASTGSAASHSGPHWSYQGVDGPDNWGKLSPDYSLCSNGTRQSPIHIEDGGTLMGPAEPIKFNYRGSHASVVNNGHTIQVDMQGDNSIDVRGSNYKLVQFHFHAPSEDQINHTRAAMVAHLVHKNDDGQLAVVAVLLEPGAANSLIEKVWTYMPLDAGDRVRIPMPIVNMNELLPKDQRYYQFLGSLTTPPCSEGVLWLVLKQPTFISKDQWRLFTQLYPRNARPIQPTNGRSVREGV